MKLNIEKRELSLLTTMVYRAASNKNTIPVLSGLLLELTPEKGLTMTATDMEIGICASTTNVDVIEAGSVLVNANYFADFIKLLPDENIAMELNVNTSKLNISYGRSKGNINIYREQDYPALPIDKMEYRFSIAQKTLKEALRKTVFAAAANHFRQVFTGVLFDIQNNNQLRVVASDTHRLAYYTHVLNETMPDPLKFVIPIRTVNELLRFLEDSEDEIKIATSENNVIFYKDGFLFLSRLIEGQYPNYEQVIPANFVTHLDIKTHVLATSLERVKIMPTDDKLKIPHLQLSFQNEEIHINSNSEVMGDINEVIEGAVIDGDRELKIVFNTNYFLDAVKIFDQECETISIALSGSFGPAMLKNNDKENYLYILVPMRTSN
jgi:DNA polymerase-3 subunit beta